MEGWRTTVLVLHDLTDHRACSYFGRRRRSSRVFPSSVQCDECGFSGRRSVLSSSASSSIPSIPSSSVCSKGRRPRRRICQRRVRTRRRDERRRDGDGRGSSHERRVWRELRTRASVRVERHRLGAARTRHRRRVRGRPKRMERIAQLRRQRDGDWRKGERRSGHQLGPRPSLRLERSGVGSART